MKFYNFSFAFLLFGCGTSGKNSTNPVQLDSNLQPQSLSVAPASGQSSGGETTAVYCDKDRKELIALQASPLRIAHRVSLPIADEGCLILPKMGDFGAIVVSGSSYYLVNWDGTIVKDPEPLTESIVTASYQPNEGALVLADTSGSLALLEMDGTGAVVRSFSAGPIVGALNRKIVAGSLLPGKTLVLALDNDDLAIVDWKASFSSHSWSFRIVSGVGVTGIKALASIQGSDHIVAIQGTDRLITWDINGNKAVASLDVLANTMSSIFLNSLSHAYARDAANEHDLFIVLRTDGQIGTSPAARSVSNIYQSLLSAEGTELAVMSATAYADGEATLYRLPDQFLKGRVRPKVNEGAFTIIDRRGVYFLAPSDLGYARFQSYTNPTDIQEISGFRVEQR